MAKLMATAGTVIAEALSLLWIITLSVPWDWLWSQNELVIFKVNLFSIYTDRGLGGVLLRGVTRVISKKAASALDSILKQSLWMEAGVQQLCMPGIDTIWGWCDTWTMVKYGSFAMIVLGYMIVVLLASGGAFMYYYAHVHATRTGRTCVYICLIGAPSCALVGMLSYIVLTLDMGKGERNLLVATEASYGPGFIMACVLTILTFVPLAIQVAFIKVDFFEKGDNDDFGPEAEPAYEAAPFYGAAVPPPGYGGAPQQGYPGGTAPPPQSSLGMAQAQPAVIAVIAAPGSAVAPVPGSGVPAW